MAEDPFIGHKHINLGDTGDAMGWSENNDGTLGGATSLSVPIAGHEGYLSSRNHSAVDESI
jgi:hypothetical protein